MIQYVLKQNKTSLERMKDKWYPVAVSTETIDLDALAKHMSLHNTPFSKGAIRGILTDMVSCIKELILEGKSVKIDDLAIFSASIKSRMVDNPSDFSVVNDVKGVKMRALATGELSRKAISLEASLREKSNYTSPRSESDSETTEG